MIVIRPDHLELVLAILAEYAPDYEVWAFGSRVNQKSSRPDSLLKGRALNDALSRVPAESGWRKATLRFTGREARQPKKHSDLDLVIKTDSPAPTRTLALLRDAFSESNLPFKVDVVVWAMISKDFQKIIEKKFEVIQKRF